MKKLKHQIEGQIQEVVFFSSLVIAFTVFVSGIAYLAFGGASLELILGSFGGHIERGFFSAFGYGYFYIAFAALHLGYITNFHIFNFNDLRRDYPVIAYSALAHGMLLTLFSNLLSVFQFSLNLPTLESLPNGAGGALGSFIAKGLYSVAGLYGSTLLILIFMVTTGLVAEFFELKDLHSTLRKTGLLSKQGLIKLFQFTQFGLTQLMNFFFKQSDFSEMAFQSSQATKSWISNSVHRANNLFTEHFHIYTRPEHTEEVTSVIEEKVELVPVETFIEKPFKKSLPAKKSFKGIVKNKKNSPKVSKKQKTSSSKSKKKNVPL